MKTLIAYASKSGTTETCATMLQSELHGADLVNLDKEIPHLEPYDTILIGGPIRYGSLHNAVHSFCTEHIDVLLKKNVGLFICCGKEEAAEKHFENNFPSALLTHAFEKQSFGGEFRLGQLSLFEKWVIKIVTKSSNKEEQPAIRPQAIHNFAEAVARLQ